MTHYRKSRADRGLGLGSEESEGARIEWEIGGPGFLGPTVTPFFVCAVCGERITQGDANALFEFDGAGGYTGRWVVVHRGDRCDPPGGPFRRWGWEELWTQLVHLLHNSGYDLEEVWRKVRRMVESERRWEEAQRQREEETG
jgi:hypothetical protein